MREYPSIFIRMHCTSFTWSRWRRACISDLGIPCREHAIISNARILRKYAIGWIEGERLLCRPKQNTVAVMFLKDDTTFWFHLRSNEFLSVFGGMI